MHKTSLRKTAVKENGEAPGRGWLSRGVLPRTTHCRREHPEEGQERSV